MNHRTFLTALALIAATALAVAATSDSPGGPTTGSEPAVGHPRRPMGEHGRPKAPPAPSAERIEQLLERMKTEQPEMYEHLMRLRGSDRRSFRRAIAGIDRLVRRLEELPRELREVVVQQRRDRIARLRLVRQYRAAADPARREAIQAEIRRLVGRMFDADQKIKEHKVEQLARELEQLKADLADRASRREELIDKTVERLLTAPDTPRPGPLGR